MNKNNRLQYEDYFDHMYKRVFSAEGTTHPVGSHCGCNAAAADWDEIRVSMFACWADDGEWTMGKFEPDGCNNNCGGFCFSTSTCVTKKPRTTRPPGPFHAPCEPGPDF